eukprot:PITA_25459
MQCWEKGPAVAQMQRELSYRCNSGNGRTMGSSIGGNSVEDVGQEGLASAQVAKPYNFQEAAQHQVWVDAMVEEYNSIMTNDVWELVPCPEDISVVGSRWISKIKYAANGSVEKYKAIFVAKGYSQKEGIDYEETFTLVAKYTSIRFIISLVA